MSKQTVTRYQSSRFTSGNFLFPDRLHLGPETIVFEKRRFFGGEEERIPYEQVASVSVNRGVFFANLLFETTGGSEPIFLNGLWAGEAESAHAAIQTHLRRSLNHHEDRMIELLEEQNRLLERIASRLEASAP